LTVRRPVVYSLLGLLVVAGLLLSACGARAPERPYEEIPFTEPMVLAAPDCEFGGLIREVAALDEHTVRFTMCRPDPAFLSKIAFSPFAIYPSEWLAYTAGETQRTEEGLSAPVGTGAYVVSEWARGESITFTRNPDYWGTPAIAETLVFRWASESAARLLELQAGTVDAIDNLGPGDFEGAGADPNLSVYIRPALNVFYIAMTDTFAPFDDVRVRQAVAMGIDRQRIVDIFYPPGSEVASHFTPCAIPNGCAGEAWYDFDAAAARELLADAGFPEGFSSSLFYRDVVRGYLPEVSRVAEEIQAQLRENLGINVEIVQMESGAFIEESTAGRLDGFYLLGWGADYPHITNFLDFHFGSANAQFGTPHPEIYELLVEGAQIPDPDDSVGIYTQANDAIRELVPMVPVAHGGSAVVYKADVEGGHASPLSNEYFAVANPGGRSTFVWMQNAEPLSMFCADETDGESLRACEQVVEALYAYEVGGTDVVPALATGCEPNDDLTVWTCTLRQGVTFHDGTAFDANDVVATFTMGLDASSPLHRANTGAWEYYDYLWGLMNVE
jgi:peptide/nickel transport system substrate-binding protein